MSIENYIYVYLIWSFFFFWFGWWFAIKLIIKFVFFFIDKSLKVLLLKRLKIIKRNLFFDIEYIIGEGMFEFGFVFFWYIF